jgi:hypothetical protein
MRIVRLQVRNPFVAAALIAVVLALLALLLSAGLVLLAGGAVVGGAMVLSRRIFGGPALPRGVPNDLPFEQSFDHPSLERPLRHRLDPSKEVFPESRPGSEDAR